MPNQTNITQPTRAEFPSDEAYDAYLAALKAILEHHEGDIILDLNGRTQTKDKGFQDTVFKALDRLPPEITTLTNLQHLDLDNTQVSDLTPISTLTNLQRLFLMSTQVSDLTPLMALPNLEDVKFRKTPATTSNSQLGEISEIENDEERLDKLRAFLKDEQDDDKTIFKKSPVKHSINTNNQVETKSKELEDTDLSDPAKCAIRDQIVIKLEEIIKRGNQFPDLHLAAKTYLDALFASQGVIYALNVYIAAQVLLDAKDNRDDLGDEPELRQSISAVALLGPALFGDDPQVVSQNENMRQFRSIEGGEESGLEAALKDLSEAIREDKVSADSTKETLRILAEINPRNIDSVSAQNRSTLITLISFTTASFFGGALDAAGQSFFETLVLNWESVNILYSTYGPEGMRALQEIQAHLKSFPEFAKKLAVKLNP